MTCSPNSILSSLEHSIPLALRALEPVSSTMVTLTSLLHLCVVALAAAKPLPAERLQARELLRPLVSSATDDQEKWCPALDYDTDSCYNTVAISRDGPLNYGYDPNLDHAWILSYCRNENRLSQTNIYVRSKCNNGWCAHMYDYYFESDFANIGSGHRHDWEHIAVWVKNGELKFVSVSAHGEWVINEKSSGLIRFEQGTHAKVVYHKDGGGTHAFRFAFQDGANDNVAENHWKSWRWGKGAGLVQWPHISEYFRKQLSIHNWGSASMAVRDDPDGGTWNFGNYLDGSRRACYNELDCPGNLAPEFNPWG
jgi:hypothetical protein